MTFRILARLGLLAIGLIAVGTACAPQGITAKAGEEEGSKPQRLLPKGPLQFGPQLSLGADLRVYAAWLSITPAQGLFDVLFSRSDDDGMTWLPAPISLQREKSRNSGSLSLFADRDGTLYTFYSLGLRTKRREVVLHRLPDRGVTSEEPLVIKSDTTLHAPVFLQALGEALYAVIPVGSQDFDWRLEVYRSIDKGRQWDQLPTLEHFHEWTGTGIRDFHLETDDQGRLHALWAEGARSEPPLVLYNRLTPDGRSGSWLSSPVRVSEGGPSSKGAQHPRFSLGGDGRIFAAWEEFWDPGVRFEGVYPPKVQVTHSLDSGGSWLKPARLSPPGTKPILSTGVTVATDGGQHGYVAWIEGDSNRPQRLQFARSTDGGTTWTTPAQLLYHAEPGSYLGIPIYLQADARGRVYLVWQQVEGERWKLFFTRSLNHGQTWLPKAYQLARMRQFDRGAHSLAFQVDGSRLFVAWDGGPRVESDIFVTRSLDFGATWLAKDVQVSRR